MRGGEVTELKMTPRLVSALYTESMLIADEVRAYFDEFGRMERDALSPLDRVGLSCESLKVTTRLMHVIAWLLTWRAVETGELTVNEACASSRRLGPAPEPDMQLMERLPERAQRLIAQSQDLYVRVDRLDHGLDQPSQDSPVRDLMNMLSSSF